METQAPPSPPETVHSNCPKWMSRWIWQILILISGTVTILVGIILIPAPGPGSLVIYAGVGILATEFIWARQLFAWLRDTAQQLMMRVRVWAKQIWRRND